MRVSLILFACFSLAFASNQIVTNHEECTRVAKKLLEQGASVFEIFIAASVCEGVVHPQDSGLGGGFQAVYYNGSCRMEPIYINSREKSPGYWPNVVNIRKSRHQIGVPSMLRGYEFLYNYDKCGYRPKLEWSALFVDSINLARNGWSASHTLWNVIGLIKNLDKVIELDSEGTARNQKMANFLSHISREGPNSSLYQPDGILNNIVSEELFQIGSDLRPDDLIRYKTISRAPIKCKFNGLIVATTHVPGSGKCICFALRLMRYIHKRNNITSQNELDKFLIRSQIIRYAYLIQPYIKTYSYAEIVRQIPMIYYEIMWNIGTVEFGLNMSLLGRFGNLVLKNQTHHNPYGTSNIIVKVGKEVMAVTSSVNWSFGSKYFSQTLGFFYNNQLADFSHEKGPNQHRSNEYPQSSMSGTVMYDARNNPVFAVGAAGGKKIVGSILLTIFNYFYGPMSLEDAVNSPRCLPIGQRLTCEFNVPETLTYYIWNNVDWAGEAGYSAVTASTTLRRKREAVFDRRRGGKGFSE